MMRLWCWRCKSEMPMLDEQEFAEIAPLYRAGMRSVKDYRKESGARLKDVSLMRHFAQLLSSYEALTGYRETNPNAVMHHRLSLYGPPCSNCGQPLRTPQARLCAACMTPRK